MRLARFTRNRNKQGQRRAQVTRSLTRRADGLSTVGARRSRSIALAVTWGFCRLVLVVTSPNSSWRSRSAHVMTAAGTLGTMFVQGCHDTGIITAPRRKQAMRKTVVTCLGVRVSAWSGWPMHPCRSTNLFLRVTGSARHGRWSRTADAGTVLEETVRVRFDSNVAGRFPGNSTPSAPSCRRISARRDRVLPRSPTWRSTGRRHGDPTTSRPRKRRSIFVKLQVSASRKIPCRLVRRWIRPFVFLRRIPQSSRIRTSRGMRHDFTLSLHLLAGCGW